MKYLKTYEMIDFQEDWEEEQYEFYSYIGDKDVYILESIVDDTYILYNGYHYNDATYDLRPRKKENLSSDNVVQIYNKKTQSWKGVNFTELYKKYPELIGKI